MSFKFIKEAITPQELLREYSLPASSAKIKKERDEQIKKVFTGESDKFLVIVGP